MGTIQKNSDWEKLIAVQKGNLGEDLVQRLLEYKNYIVLRPTTEKAHWFDMFVMSDKSRPAHKIDQFVAEVKSKPYMFKYNATGVNYRNFEEYWQYYNKTGTRIFLFFVDEIRLEIYGNYLDELEKPSTVKGVSYPFNLECKGGRVIRLYSLENMVTIAKLKAETAAQLKELSRRSYEYK